MKKALIVCTVAEFLDFEVNNISLLQNLGYEVTCATNFDDGERINKKLYTLNTINCQIDFERTPFSKNNVKAYKQLKQLIENNIFDIIHCHTPMGGVLGRLCAVKTRKRGTRVIYTAHGFHFFSGAPIKNWLIYYPVEKICSLFTDVLITINHEDYKRAQKKLFAKETIYIPGVGVDINKIEKQIVNAEEKRKELGVPDDMVWMLTVGELNERKNHRNLIKAVSQIDNIYLTIAGSGSLYDEMMELIIRLRLQDRVKLIGFRTDVIELCKSADMFALPSLQEGLPVALMEAMACAKPCVVSEIRGNIDIIDHNGGTFFDPNSVEDCKYAIEKIISLDRSEMGKYNENKIKNFRKEIVMDKMKKIYEKVK